MEFKLFLISQFWDIGWGEETDADNSRRNGASSAALQPSHAHYESVRIHSAHDSTWLDPTRF